MIDWHPCGDCAYYGDCKMDYCECEYSDIVHIDEKYCRTCYKYKDCKEMIECLK